jgi:hypothetical protein
MVSQAIALPGISCVMGDRFSVVPLQMHQPLFIATNTLTDVLRDCCATVTVKRAIASFL